MHGPQTGKDEKHNCTIGLKRLSSAVTQHNGLAISVFAEIPEAALKIWGISFTRTSWLGWQDELLLNPIQYWICSKSYIWLSELKEGIAKCKIRQKLDFPPESISALTSWLTLWSSESQAPLPESCLVLPCAPPPASPARLSLSHKSD